MKKTFLLTAGLAVVLTVSTVGFPRAAQEPVDTASIEKIKAIGLNPESSKVMEIASYLTDVYGPRLTGSANIKRAADWSVERMKEWGLANAALEPWGGGGGGRRGAGGGGGAGARPPGRGALVQTGWCAAKWLSSPRPRRKPLKRSSSRDRSKASG